MSGKAGNGGNMMPAPIREPPERGSAPVRRSVPKPDHRAHGAGSGHETLLSMLGVDSGDDDVPGTIIGLLADYEVEGEDSRDLVRSVRDGD